jgi:NADH-quinone oxidoreductase subunit L
MTETASSLGWLWCVPAAPFAAFALIGLLTRPWKQLSAAISIVAASVACLLSWGALFSQIKAGPEAVRTDQFTWFATATLKPVIGILLDPLSAVMLVTVTTVALMVQVYSLGYMGRDKGLSRYYAYMSLFLAAMLGLVLSNNFLETYVCWELVGVCSYLLIGFWYDRDASAFAAKKAFVTTRLGDLGLLIGLIMICTRAGSFDFAEIRGRFAAGGWEPAWLTLVSVLVFCGAAGKSAQVPLHVWLPDAMEGPTPVSALIHAATMVAAGVFLVARTFFLFAGSPDALAVVAGVGAVTAAFAASIALVQVDIKRVLAYSTISQLGYMMLALGLGGLGAGIFHLFTHAFFKSLLFLGAGSVIHALGTNDIREMGGLRKSMPITFWTFAAGSLALAGVAPLSGFFSKDAILHLAWEKSPALFVLASATAVMTSFYMARVFFIAFLGAPKSKAAQGAHEAPVVMLVPLVILAAFSVLAGWWAEDFSRFVYFGVPAEGGMKWGFAAAMQAVPLAGILVAYRVYVVRSPEPGALAARLEPIHTLLKRRYYVDEAYDWLVDNVVLRLSAVLAWFDRRGVDGAVNLVARLVRRTGDGVRRLQTGRVSNYVLAVFAGVIAAAVIVRLSGAG